jgi:hypothetical protein
VHVVFLRLVALNLADRIDKKKYPLVYDFISNHVEMQFIDVRGMLKLPLPKQGISGGCNFAATAVLCNLISGISRTLYNPKEKSGAKKPTSGKLFKELLRCYYPWEDSERKQMECKIKTLYEVIRNPLVHALGVVDESNKQNVIEKRPLSIRQIDEIERSNKRPSWIERTVRLEKNKCIINVPGLYWGTYHTLIRLLEDDSQMTLTEERFRKGKITNRNPSKKE